MDGRESEGVHWALMEDIRRSDAGLGCHGDNHPVPTELALPVN